jgi:chitodextrinase
MQIPWMRRIFEALLLLCLPLLISACGGGGGGGRGGGEDTTVVSGVAVKGPISGALVQIFQLTPGGAPGTLFGSGSTGAAGNFAVAIPNSAAAGTLLITVTGGPGASYLSESSGSAVPFGSGESFSAMVPAGSVLQGITVSPLTEAAYRKLQQVLTADPTLATAANLSQVAAAVNSRIGSLTGSANILADPAGDIRYRAYLLIVDQMIVDAKVTNPAANSTTVMNIINNAFVDADLNAPAYQIYLQALNAAADRVKADNAGNNALLTALDQVKALAANPPAEPDFTDVTAPSAPANLSATASALSSTSASVLLAWNASSDNDQVAGYDIFRNGSKIAASLTPNYTDSAVSFGVTYSYFVVAFDGAGNRSAASNQASVTPIRPNLDVVIGGQVGTDVFGLPLTDNVPPAAPVLLSATPSALTATVSSVLLSWSASSDNVAVTGYDLFRNGSKIATVTTPGYNDPSLLSGVAYSYSVIAFDAKGNRSPLSNLLSVTPPQPPLDVVIGGQVQP